MLKHTFVLLGFTLFNAGFLQAAEVDSFSTRAEMLKDDFPFANDFIQDFTDSQIKTHILDANDAECSFEWLADRVQKALGDHMIELPIPGGVFSHPLEKISTYTGPIESALNDNGVYAKRLETKDSIYDQVGPEDSAVLYLAGTAAVVKFRTKFNENIIIGGDKFSHFISQGFAMWEAFIWSGGMEMLETKTITQNLQTRGFWGDTWGSVSDWVSDKVEDVKETVSDEFEDVKETVSDKVEDVKEFVSDKVEDVKDVAEDVKNAIQDAANRVKDKWDEYKRRREQDPECDKKGLNPLECALAVNQMSETGFFGLGEDGNVTPGSAVYSNGDLSANYGGFRFWRDISSYFKCENKKWTMKKKFLWADHVTPAFDEGINKSAYDMDKVRNSIQDKMNKLHEQGLLPRNEVPLIPGYCESLAKNYGDRYDKTASRWVLHPSCLKLAHPDLTSESLE